MPHDLPIACSLSAADLEERLTQMADLGRDALIDSHTDGSRAQLRFAAHAGVRDRLDAVVAAESRCCAFLSMRVSEEPETLMLTIDAPDGAELALSELVDAFGAERAPD